MSDIADRLLTILGAEEDIYVRLRDLLQEERELMLRLDAVGLERVARRKEQLADEGRLVEESRIAVAAELGRNLGLDEARPTLGYLCERLGPDAGPLRDAHTRLVVLVSVAQELLDANRALAGESLEQVQGTLRLLGAMLPVETVYDRGTGHLPQSGQLVRRTA